MRPGWWILGIVTLVLMPALWLWLNASDVRQYRSMSQLDKDHYTGGIAGALWWLLLPVLLVLSVAVILGAVWLLDVMVKALFL